MNREQFRAAVAHAFCRDHSRQGGVVVCDIGKKAGAAAVAVLDEHHLTVTELEPADD